MSTGAQPAQDLTAARSGYLPLVAVILESLVVVANGTLQSWVEQAAAAGVGIVGKLPGFAINRRVLALGNGCACLLHIHLLAILQ